MGKLGSRFIVIDPRENDVLNVLNNVALKEVKNINEILLLI